MSQGIVCEKTICITGTAKMHTCACACACVRARVCMCVFNAYGCTCIYIYICIYTHIICIYIHICICMHTYIHTYSPAHIYVYTYIHTYIHIIHIHVRICIYVYIRTHIASFLPAGPRTRRVPRNTLTRHRRAPASLPPIALASGERKHQRSPAPSLPSRPLVVFVRGNIPCCLEPAGSDPSHF